MALCRRRGLLVALAVAAAAATTALAGGGDEAAWIRSARVLAAGATPSYDGAIARYPDVPLQAIDPYWAGYAAMGLARAGDPASAWRWVSWYQARMDGAGVVPNVLLTPTGTIPPSYSEADAPTPSYDSADAYAATFVLALREAFRSDPSRSRLSAHRAGLERAVGLLRALQDPVDGLLWNLPPASQRAGDTRPRVKLLMDQAEDYAALRAAADLAGALGRSKLRSQATAAAVSLRAGVVGLWVAGSASYAWAKLEGGALVPSDTSRWYPDAIAQPFLVAAGNWLSPAAPLVDGARAEALVDAFAVHWPEWATPSFSPSPPRRAGTGSGLLEYQPLLGAAFVAVGRAAEGRAGTAAIDAAAASAGRPWPFGVGHAGQVLLVLAP